ncbi:MFS transporter [Ornithinimicrobium tianjinense]|uniref:MFS transporter n=1 Tax=Ornithinimicrobium tianjinense TaxID=1195761 RepID=A0A917BUN7_9MICO|nr:MFS transporter [Ornithinimicrobium tianjinense]GGF57460.1 MFS transporter [Ornithinimicrobium tianjinense]
MTTLVSPPGGPSARTLVPPGPPAAAPGLTSRPRRWVDGWDPEDPAQWTGGGKQVADRNLRWSIFAEFLGFCVWQLWSIVVVSLPAAGFDLTTGQLFWLISMPALVGATLRIPYTFAVSRFGGRNWTIVSTGLLLVPTTGLALVVQRPDTSFGVLLVVAALAGVGGGNFASSMANITFFYPQRDKGWALGLNAAGGNLGAAVAQLVVPIVITVGAGTALALPLAGWVWVPLILVAMVGAAVRMDNLTTARADVWAMLAVLREPHLWVMSLLYVATFGSFIGFAGVFPKLVADQFPQFSAFQVGSASLSLAFLGALVGSLSRPFGGRLADRFGGTVVTMGSLSVLALGALAVSRTIELATFPVFLGLFLVIFAAAGIGNGSTYRMVPTIFALRAGEREAHHRPGDVGAQRAASAALGLISAVGAYGGFLIPQALGRSQTVYGTYEVGLLWFVAAYAVILAVTGGVYLRMSRRTGVRI